MCLKEETTFICLFVSSVHFSGGLALTDQPVGISLLTLQVISYLSPQHPVFIKITATMYLLLISEAVG